EQVVQECEFLVRLPVSAHSRCPHPVFVLTLSLKNTFGRAVVPVNTPSLPWRLDRCERNDSLCRNRCASSKGWLRFASEAGLAPAKSLPHPSQRENRNSSRRST